MTTLATIPARRWLITGVSSGLGRALAEHALAQGDTVIGTLRRPDQADAFEGLAPGRAVALLLDLTDDAAIPQRVPEAVERTGGLDVLVNNAGYSLIGAVEETSLEEAREIMATNLYGPMLLTQAVLPLFRGQGHGCVVNVSSVASTIGFPLSAMYSASKSAFAAWSDALAAEVSGFGVKVTCLEPGGLRTNFAGPSLRSVDRSLPAYADAVTAVRQRYAAAAGAMPNDAAKAAAVIDELVRQDDLPPRVAVGADAHTYLTNALEARISGYARLRDQTAHTAFTAPALSPS
jgi:NAD(P)-dependent dehydrogenase (short-subunit alcohol dehydrogenase family)